MMVNAQKGISRSNMLLAITAGLLASTALSAPSQAGMYIAQPQSHMFTSRLNVPTYQPVSYNPAAYMAPRMNMRVLPTTYNRLVTQPARPMPTVTYHTPGLMPTGMAPIGRAPFHAGPIYNYTSQRRRVGYGPSVTTSAPRYHGYMQQVSYQPTYHTIAGNSNIIPTFMGSSFNRPTYQNQGGGSAAQQLHNRWISPMQQMVPQAVINGRNNFLRPVSMGGGRGNGLLPPPAVNPRSQLNVIPAGYRANNMLMPTGNPPRPLGMSYGVQYGPVVISSKTVGRTAPVAPSPYQQLPYGGGPLIINSTTVPTAPVQPKRRTSAPASNSSTANSSKSSRTKPVSAPKATAPKKVTSTRQPTGTKQAASTPSKIEAMEKKQAKPTVAAPPASKTVTPAAPAPAKVDQAAPKQPAPITKPAASAAVLGTASFESDSAELSGQAKQSLDQVAAPLKDDANKRIQLLAYAKANSDDTSRARRLSLSRALAVRSYLIEKGIQSTRIDVRALGSKTDKEPEDRVDIVALP